jgi:Cu+-exporting ATPase
MTYLAFRNLFQQKFRLVLSVSRVALNPVCGMSVDRDSSPARTEYEGQVYYFCANGCREEFLANPAKFLAGMEVSHGG